MASLYTKNGKPLQVHGDKVHSKSGKYIGRIRNDRIYATDGTYLATIVGERAVYRRQHSSTRTSRHSQAMNRTGIRAMNRSRSSLQGDEPHFPD